MLNNAFSYKKKKNQKVFSGQQTPSSFGGAVGYAMAIIPNKNWLMLCHKNTTTNTDDMLQVTQVSETLMTA